MIVLDTHAFLWWRDESPKLSPRALAAITGADRVGVPSACCLELAALERRGRIALGPDAATWIRRALAAERID